MRKLLLTTAFAFPLTMGAALAQDTAPATDPAMEPTTTETTTTEPMATQPMGTEATGAEMTETETDADEAAAASSAAQKVEQEQAANEWRVDWITGTTVRGTQGEDIGSINDLIVDGDTGEMKAAIVGVGGFLGIGEKSIALPWSELTINSDAQEITSDLTREEADAAPEYVFRDQEGQAGMMSDPAGDPNATPAADPMATGTTAPATGGMATDTMATDPAATAPMDGTTTTTTTEPVEGTTTTTTEPMDTTTVPADGTSTTEGTAPAN
ncbi:PRC-barrel domain-containing protein [Paracoccus sp. (in: a-proteobacteria)]|uniref:PRC-barrel domain-containing protein n=1 Tax=Paracoccus sp. TaxID=267 RepID=UPI00396CBC67